MKAGSGARESAPMVTEFGVNQVLIFLKFELVPKALRWVLGRLPKIFRPFTTCTNVVEIRLISSIATFINTAMNRENVIT